MNTMLGEVTSLWVQAGNIDVDVIHGTSTSYDIFSILVLYLVNTGLSITVCALTWTSIQYNVAIATALIPVGKQLSN